MKSLMYKNSDIEFISIVKESNSITEVAKKMGYNNCHGHTNNLFRQRCQELNIDYSHFGTNSGKTKRTVENVFCENSTASQQVLRNWFLKNQNVDYKCSLCGISEWQGKELSLRLDHINGCNNDNRLENLRWVCPNCDSQLGTYCGRNRPLKEKTRCLKCGIPLQDSRSSYCRGCYQEKLSEERINNISREELKTLIRTNSFVNVGKMLQLSDNGVRKRCAAYGLPTKKSDINKFSEEEWVNL